MTGTDPGKDRAASLPLGEVVDLVGHLAATGASLRRLIAGSATGATAREPAAPTEPSVPRPAAAEAPAASRCEHGIDRSRVYCPPCGPDGTSPLATRVLTALLEMPDAEFLAMANKVLNRYYAAVAALAPEGQQVRVECIHCGAVQTHRVCQACFANHGPQPVEEPVHNVWAASCAMRTEDSPLPIDNEVCKACWPKDYDG